MVRIEGLTMDNTREIMQIQKLSGMENFKKLTIRQFLEREKLVELVCDAMEDGCVGHCNHPPCFQVERVVNSLIANGVTVQKWIPIAEQKPNRDDLILVFFEGMRDTNCAIQVMYGWCIGGSASHWMPLPQAPKEG